MVRSRVFLLSAFDFLLFPSVVAFLCYVRTRRGSAGLIPSPWGEGLEFGHSPRTLLAEANPQGWETVAGGRSGQKGNDRRKTASDGRAPRRGARSWETCPQQPPGPQSSQQVIRGTHVRRVPAQFSAATPISSRLGSDRARSRKRFRVVPAVTRRHPHRPVRADFPHTVPRVTVSLHRWNVPLALGAGRRTPAAGSSVPTSSLAGRPDAPAISAIP